MKEQDVHQTFVAVSRDGMEINKGKWYERYKVYADENLATLNQMTSVASGSTSPPFFECGKKLLQQHFEAPKFGSLLQSIVNFYIATESKAFVGVRGSSYSTDIWTTRYHQGRGLQNYEYTTEEIKRLENNGLPPTHKFCSSGNDKKEKKKKDEKTIDEKEETKQEQE
eukprot:CAMPEP_0116862804 /NCGR_PEP_ID=MMETSP0418-20121206/23848_1 /TAXON_ID=1158023 /ORGANISM="Astrosyne radiata, Strain 13vi08-1A" /LENGTH=167 /DNA_ID=CAMNT_0004497711 /DNA_START=54 /DNA_END=557 /DNA_ORIENTATION=+